MIFHEYCAAAFVFSNSNLICGQFFQLNFNVYKLYSKYFEGTLMGNPILFIRCTAFVEFLI